MKFSNGQWLDRKGYQVTSPAQAYDIDLEKDSMTVTAPGHPVLSRGNTLGGPLLTIKYSSPMPDIICVQAYNFKGAIRKQPEFVLNENNRSNITINENDDEASLSSGSLTVKIQKKGGWKVDFHFENRYLTDSAGKNMAYISTDNKNTYMREQLALGAGECIYGLGERFTPFVKNGQIVDMWNEDCGTSSEQAYKNIPFYISNRGYGVFVNHPECVSYEIASEKVSRVQFSVAGEFLEYYIIGGSTPKDVLINYTNLTGKPALPPAWSFGLWLSTSFTTDYDEETVNSFLDGMVQRDLPLHVFHYDCFWMKEYQWCDFKWDKNKFPAPEKMLERLKSKGLKICVWINPYIGQKSPLFDEGMEKGYLLKRPNGDVWQWDMWQPGLAIVDFTNPGACTWFQSKLKALLDMGVDCFKTDFGERIPTDIVYYDGSDPLKMHNYYAYLYNKTVFEIVEKTFGKNKAMVFARSATVGNQKFPVHWGGDCTANFGSMAESLRGGLSLCLSGFGFWSHDIGGFEETAAPSVYKRWIAFGLLSSHSRLHGSTTYRVPWLFDDESVDVLRFFTKLKCSLMPYLFSMACDAADKGIPMMRAMFLEFPDDRSCDYLDRQYMLGDSLLVAPIFNEEGTADYYLPKGDWVNYLTGEKIEGGSWKNEQHGYMSVPLLVRPNTIIAVGKQNARPDYDYANEVTLNIFSLQEGSSASAKVHNTDGVVELDVYAKFNEKVITINITGVGKPFSIKLIGILGIRQVAGGTFRYEDFGTRIVPDSYTGILKIYLP